MLACWLRNGLRTETTCRNQRVSENRRLVDVEGVMVLGVDGITEPVELPSTNLIFLPFCEPPEIRRLRKSETFHNLQLACRGAGGRREGIQS
jgi:hypothetical protein